MIATVALTKHLYPSSILYSVLLVLGTVKIESPAKFNVRDIVLFLIISVLCIGSSGLIYLLVASMYP